MSKRHSVSVTLLDSGYLIDDLHYGHFAKNWWQPNPNKENIFFPIRVGQKTKVHLNGCDFYVSIVCGNKESAFSPGYICETDIVCSFKEVNPTVAISNIYQKTFKKQTSVDRRS